MRVKNGVSRTENTRVTSPGVRTLVRYKSLPTRESLRVRSPERTQHAHSSRPSKNVVPWKNTVSFTIWKVSNIWITTQNTSRQGATHVARHYCQDTVYYPIPSSPSTHNRVLSLKIPKYLGPQNRISLVSTKISLKTREDLGPDLPLPPSRFVGVPTRIPRKGRERKRKIVQVPRDPARVSKQEEKQKQRHKLLMTKRNV